MRPEGQEGVPRTDGGTEEAEGAPGGETGAGKAENWVGEEVDEGLEKCGGNGCPGSKRRERQKWSMLVRSSR